MELLVEAADTAPSPAAAAAPPVAWNFGVDAAPDELSVRERVQPALQMVANDPGVPGFFAALPHLVTVHDLRNGITKPDIKAAARGKIKHATLKVLTNILDGRLFNQTFLAQQKVPAAPALPHAAARSAALQPEHPAQLKPLGRLAGGGRAMAAARARRPALQPRALTPRLSRRTGRGRCRSCAATCGRHQSATRHLHSGSPSCRRTRSSTARRASRSRS